jgi:hypothetical protein
MLDVFNVFTIKSHFEFILSKAKIFFNTKQECNYSPRYFLTAILIMTITMPNRFRGFERSLFRSKNHDC